MKNSEKHFFKNEYRIKNLNLKIFIYFLNKNKTPISKIN